MPATPRRCWWRRCSSASMDPLAVVDGRLRGREVPSAMHTFVLFLPNYACALVGDRCRRDASAPARAAGCARRRRWAAITSSSCSAAAAWARCGARRHRLLARSAAIKLVRPELLGAGTDAEASGDAAPVRARGAGHGRAELAAHDPAVRLRRHRRPHVLLRDGAARRAATSSRWCGSSGRCRPTASLYLLRQVCHSLAEAHARGLVHRDITPANIYVCRMGLDYDFVKVLDFGLVTFNDQREVERTLMTGGHAHATGTPAFMAPEIILEGDVDAARRRLRARLRRVLPADRPAGLRSRHADEDVRPASAGDAASRRRSAPSCRFRADARRAGAGVPREGPGQPARRTPRAARAARPVPARRAWTTTPPRRWWERHLSSWRPGRLRRQPARVRRRERSQTVVRAGSRTSPTRARTRPRASSPACHARALAGFSRLMARY